MVLENSQAVEGFRGSVCGMTASGGCEDWILCSTFDFPLVQYTFTLMVLLGVMVPAKRLD